MARPLSMNCPGGRWRCLLLPIALFIVAAAPAPMPRLESRDGRHALIVDGKPFLMLGAQVNNSSNYPSALPQVWPMAHRLHLNTLEVPVAWEQLEPVEGQFDYSFVDTLLAEARKNDMRLVLLWFGTWKNGSSTYVPEWVKTDGRRFPRALRADGTATATLSPFGEATLAADKRAFVMLMRHLRAADPQHTVIMVQIENEVGSWNEARDYSPAAQTAFAAPVPAEVAAALHAPAGSWASLGPRAEDLFSAWAYARYVDAIAVAGKAEKPLPMYVNSTVADPFQTGGAAHGAPWWPNLDVWKAAAPHVEMAAPDIYDHDAKAFAGILDRYARRDNPLFVPELGNSLDMARFFWLALGKGAVGFAPFGMDATGYVNYPLGARVLDEATLDAFAAPYALFDPIAGDWAAIAAAHPTWGSAKSEVGEDQSTVMGRWRVRVSYGLNSFGEPDWKFSKMVPPDWANQPVGGAVVAQIDADTFLIAGQYSRLRFALAQPGQGEAPMILSAEEGSFVNGRWVMQRRWNGDQIDYGFNFGAKPALLRVRLGSYK